MMMITHEAIIVKIAIITVVGKKDTPTTIFSKNLRIKMTLVTDRLVIAFIIKFCARIRIWGYLYIENCTNFLFSNSKNMLFTICVLKRHLNMIALFFMMTLLISDTIFEFLG